MQNDEPLIAGFSDLVQRVAHLEALLHALLNGEHPLSHLSRPAGRLADGPPDGDFTSPISPATADLLDDDTVSPSIPARSPEPDGDPITPLIDRAWRQAPLRLRARFVRDLLPPAHPLQPVLKEAVGLEELWEQGLETWLAAYPSLFADAMERLEAHPACGASVPETLAAATLQEVRENFAVRLEALDIQWLQPSAGALIGEEHEVVGEAGSPVPADRVAAVRRRGFRQHGKLILPAQVVRSRGESREGAHAPGWPEPEATSPATPAHPPAPEAHPPATAAAAWPDWLRTFQQRSQGCELAAMQRLLAGLQELAQTAAGYLSGTRSEADLAACLEPLLPLLGARYVPGALALPDEWDEIVTEMRDDMRNWLRSALDIEVIMPEPGARCNAVTMQFTGARRTAHAHEDGTVAKVERIGLRRGERVLFRAQVLRYEIGGGYE